MCSAAGGDQDLAVHSSGLGAWVLCKDVMQEVAWGSGALVLVPVDVLATVATATGGDDAHDDDIQSRRGKERVARRRWCLPRLLVSRNGREEDDDMQGNRR